MGKKTDVKLIDMHTHILPGVDDGASDLQKAVELCRLAWENGTRSIILTPHHRGNYKEPPAVLQAAYTALKQAVQKELPRLSLHLGCEICFQNHISQKINDRQVLPLCDSRYVLLEFSPTAFPVLIKTGIIESLSAGKVPIIAHAERYDAFRVDRFLAEDAIKMGALIQLNADSVLGKRGLGTKRFCHKLLKAEMVHFIASDAHDRKRRPPVLLSCYNRICKKYGEKYAKRLFWRNPRAIIENAKV